MKTNNYLRAIDRRLGNPVNTYTVVNEVSWRVYKRDVRPLVSHWCYLREMMRFYFLKFGLTAAYFGVRLRQMCGMRVSTEEL